MGAFSGFNDAAISGRGVYFLQGLYRCTVDEIRLKESRKKELLYIVECTIIQSNIPSTRPPGMACSWIANMKHDATNGNIKRFLAASWGVAFTEEEWITKNITEEFAEYSCGNAQPIKGKQVDLEAVNIETRNHTPFTLHNWWPVGHLSFTTGANGVVVPTVPVSK